MPRVELAVTAPGFGLGGGGHGPPETLIQFTEILRGPKGDRGDPGPPGAAGAAAQAYRHPQSVAASVWTVQHNLGYRPGGIYVEDSTHSPIIGRVHHIDANNLTISFFVQGVPAAVGGEADIS